MIVGDPGDSTPAHVSWSSCPPTSNDASIAPASVDVDEATDPLGLAAADWPPSPSAPELLQPQASTRSPTETRTADLTGIEPPGDDLDGTPPGPRVRSARSRFTVTTPREAPR